MINLNKKYDSTLREFTLRELRKIKIDLKAPKKGEWPVYDEAIAHMEAEDLLLEFVESLGYKSIVEAYKAIPKGYGDNVKRL